MIGKLSISNLPAIKFDGEYRVLGCIPSSDESLFGFPMFGDQMGLAAAEWQEIDMSWLNPPVLDQKATSACTAFASNGGMHVCTLKTGKPLTEFNPFFTYGLINGGKDAGAMISQTLSELMASGACPKEFLPAGLMYQNQFPPQAFENAKRFRLEKAFRCATFEEICSAISLGFVCPLGILVGSNFPQLDSDGVAPLPNRGGGGHAILGVGLKKSQKYGWLIKILNSWSIRFGMKGYCYIHKGHFQFMRPDAFAIQTLIDDPLDKTSEDDVPVAKVA